MVLPGVRMCSPFEEGILYSSIDGSVAHPSGLGEEGGFKTLREVGSLLCFPQQLGKINFTWWEWDSCPATHKCCFCPWRPSHTGASMLHTKSFPRQWCLEGAHHHRCGKCNTGPGVAGHQMLPVSGAQHAPAFCQLFQGFTARAVCSGCFFYPAVGPRHCCAVGVWAGREGGGGGGSGYI